MVEYSNWYKWNTYRLYIGQSYCNCNIGLNSGTGIVDPSILPYIRHNWSRLYNSYTFPDRSDNTRWRNTPLNILLYNDQFLYDKLHHYILVGSFFDRNFHKTQVCINYSDFHQSRLYSVRDIPYSYLPWSNNLACTRRCIDQCLYHTVYYYIPMGSRTDTWFHIVLVYILNILESLYNLDIDHCTYIHILVRIVLGYIVNMKKDQNISNSYLDIYNSGFQRDRNHPCT